MAKEIGVVVANIDQFGNATNRFVESPAANGIAGFLFGEMHVKEKKELVKLTSKFCASRVSQLGFCRDSV